MSGTRRARIVTDHADAATASRIADAIRPDNTDDMATRVEGSAIETTIERPTAGSLRSTADDYVVNLQVAAELATTDTHDP